MKNLVKQIVFGLIAVASASTPSYAHDTSNAKAAELSLHRIERLVILHKIPGTFLTNLSGLSLSKPTQAQPTDPFFESLITQVPAADGTQNKVDILMDDDGKAISFTQTTAGDSANPPVWPTTDSVTFLEYSLHCLQGELIGTNTLCQTTTVLRDFDKDFLSASLVQKTLASGVTIAEISVLKVGSASMAIIRFNTDGSLAAVTPIEIIP